MKKIINILILYIVIFSCGYGAEYQDSILKIINNTRKENGLKPLKINPELNEIAIIKAKDMASEEKLSHSSKTFGMTFDLIKKRGIKYSSGGENIARWHETPEFVAQRWLASSGHRKNILNSEYDETGIGMAKDKAGKKYWVQIFIKRKKN